MNLQQALDDYLIIRRGLGFKLHSDGKALSSFVAFMALNDKDIITTALALDWATLSTGVNPARWTKRLGYVRGFARYCKALEPLTEVPPNDLLTARYRRTEPYLFTDNDISRLLTATLQRPTKDPFINQTLYCLFGLLSVTGLRSGEALALTMDDVDLTAGVLTINDAKFGKSRLVPLHETTVDALINYGKQREDFLSGQHQPCWFINRYRQPLRYAYVRYHFDKLAVQCHADEPPETRKPNMHALRHHFALSVLLNWYHNQQDVERCLPILSAYLGHVNPDCTYWYLSANPELMAIARERLEQYRGEDDE